MNGPLKLLGCCCLLIWGLSCRPASQKEPPATNLEDTLSLTQVDSSHQVTQDGLDYAPLNTGTYDQLPPQLTQLLNEQYPGWVLPSLSAEDLRNPQREQQGPYYVSADFDQNGIADYAVQFQLQDSILVVAYLQQASHKPIKFMLSRQPVGRLNGEEKSRLLLSQESLGTKPAAAPRPGNNKGMLAIVTGKSSRVFVFQNGRFLPLEKR